jgi:hypothetical protein
MNNNHPVMQLNLALSTHFANVALPHDFEVPIPALTPEGIEPPVMRGNGFYPLADGLYKPDGDYTDKPFPVKGLTFLGQDFDAEKEFGQLLAAVKAGYQQEPIRGKNLVMTWVNLIPLIQSAGIALENCLFSNVFKGIRIAPSPTGPSTAFNSPAFVRSSVEFLDRELQITGSRVIFALGLATFRALLSQWAPAVSASQYRSIAAVDAHGHAWRAYQRDFGVVHVGFLAHPCMRNQRHRKFQTASGEPLVGAAAEREILKRGAAIRSRALAEA